MSKVDEILESIGSLTVLEAAELKEKMEEEFGVSWDGVLPMLERWFEKTESQWVKDHLQQFMGSKTCPDCHGDRLRSRSTSSRLGSIGSPSSSVSWTGSSMRALMRMSVLAMTRNSPALSRSNMSRSSIDARYCLVMCAIGMS